MKSSCNFIKNPDSNKSEQIKSWTPVKIEQPVVDEPLVQENLEPILVKDNLQNNILSRFFSNARYIDELKKEKGSDKRIYKHKHLSQPGNNESGLIKEVDFTEYRFERISNKQSVSEEITGEQIVERQEKLEEAGKILENARNDAENIVQQAREEAEEILRTTNEKIEQIRTEAFAEGVEKGKQEAGSIIETAKTVLQETYNWRKDSFEKSEKDIIQLLQGIAVKMFGNGFVLNEQETEHMVARAISEANRLGNLRIFLNNDDHAKLVSLWQDTDMTLNGQRIQLLTSQNIKPGGCFIEGEFGSVDSRIDMQTEMITKEIAVTFAKREEENS